MEPLSALSLVAAVIQFVDFGGNLLSESHQIYKSASGASSENAVLEDIYGNLSRLADKMKVSSGLTAQNSSKEEEALGKLATSCKDMADDLMVTIEELKVKGDTHRKWKSFRSALKTVGKKSYIEELRRRLDNFSLQLTVQLAAIIRDQQSQVLGDISSLTQESRRMQTDHKNELEKITETLTSTRQSIGFTENANLSQTQTAKLAAALCMAALAATDMATEHKILKSLYFKTLTARQTKIVKAHEETFDWILKHSSTSFSSKSKSKRSEVRFVDWLRSDSGIYWISGKPGSGKSTLMKYLSDNPKVEENLRVWAGDIKLVIASFYFWNAGNSMQKSQEGLLQSLIFEVLRKCPSLIKSVCPDRWDSTERNTIYDTSWNLPELAQVMTNLISQTSMPVKFCFFIDGLDEYEGDHHEVIRVLDVINSNSNIKICLSSRPWNVFEDAFGQDPTRKLYMQDLTRGDIEIYVRSKLENHRAFRLRVSDQEDYQNLVVRTVNKSDGVFLWVFLVVRSLLEGLTNEDSIRTLEARLDSLPADLEDYFGHILEKVDMVYRRDMARTFQETLQATEPLTLIMHSYLDESDAHHALRMDGAPMDNYDMYTRTSQMRRRINGRCKGLLEPCFDPSLTTFWGHKVEFLHRTVRDYLLTKDMQSMLEKYMGTEGSSFSANKSLCRGYLALVKCMPRGEDQRSLLRLQIENLLYHARQAEKQTEMSDRELLDNLEWTIEDWDPPNSYPPLPLKIFQQRSASNTLVSDLYASVSVFQLAVAYGLDIYVAEKLSDVQSFGPALGYALHTHFTPVHGDLDNNSMVQLLLTRSCGSDSSNYKHYFLTNPSNAYCNTVWGDWLMGAAKDHTAAAENRQQSAHRLQTLQILLHYGAQPNITNSVGSSTLWKELLKYVDSRGRLSAEESTYLYQILDALITHGADPDVEIKNENAYYANTTLQTATAKFPKRLNDALLSRARQSKETARRKPDLDRGSWNLRISWPQCCGHRKRNSVVLRY